MNGKLFQMELDTGSAVSVIAKQDRKTTMAEKLYYVSSVNVQLKHCEQLMKCIHTISFLLIKWS